MTSPLISSIYADQNGYVNHLYIIRKKKESLSLSHGIKYHSPQLLVLLNADTVTNHHINNRRTLFMKQSIPQLSIRTMWTKGQNFRIYEKWQRKFSTSTIVSTKYARIAKIHTKIHTNYHPNDIIAVSTEKKWFMNHLILALKSKLKNFSFHPEDHFFFSNLTILEKKKYLTRMVNARICGKILSVLSPYKREKGTLEVRRSVEWFLAINGSLIHFISISIRMTCRVNVPLIVSS